MHTLMDSTTGRYLVHTASGSTYEVSLDQMFLRRWRGDDHDLTSGLRRDDDQVRLVQIVEATVGRIGVFLVDLDLTGVAATVRQTTRIVAIDALETRQ